MFDFKFLTPFIEDEKITDINYNGHMFWVDHLELGRYPLSLEVEYLEVKNMIIKLSHYVNQTFNPQTPVLEADIKNLRISVIHESVVGLLSLSIRKSLARLRYSEESLVQEKFISKSALNFLKLAVKTRSNIMVSGLPGAGKTEFLKFLSRYIDNHQRVITIEDSYELHYAQLFPQRDSISMRVNRFYSYRDAIKASLRQRPDWILLSEVRGDEVLDLFNASSSGVHLMSTIHAQSAGDIGRRIEALIPSYYHRSFHISTLINIGVHIDIVLSNDQIKRRIREIVVYTEMGCEVIYHFNQKKDARKIPNMIKEKMTIYGVKI